jgi:hypothetical protein
MVSSRGRESLCFPLLPLFPSSRNARLIDHLALNVAVSVLGDRFDRRARSSFSTERRARSSSFSTFTFSVLCLLSLLPRSFHGRLIDL